MARMLLLSSSSVSSPRLPLALLAAFMALLSIALTISALCASHHRKSRNRSPPQSRSTPEANESKEEEKVEVVLPATHGPIGPTDPPCPMTPRRKLSVSLSLKIPEGLSRVRTGRREARDKDRAAGAAAEESVWMKTIILGEKCKVPENGEEAAAAAEEEGNGQKNYHPRTPRSMPISRTNSFIVIPAS